MERPLETALEMTFKTSAMLYFIFLDITLSQCNWIRKCTLIQLLLGRPFNVRRKIHTSVIDISKARVRLAVVYILHFSSFLH